MNRLVQTDEDRARMAEIARSWVNTPYVADGAVRGTGCSCTALPYAVLREYGMKLPPLGTRRGVQRSQIIQVITSFMDTCGAFARVSLEELDTGDLLLFDLGIGHMALALNSAEILHCLAKGGTRIESWQSDLTKGRFIAAWRPLIQSDNGQHEK